MENNNEQNKQEQPKETIKIDKNKNIRNNIIIGITLFALGVLSAFIIICQEPNILTKITEQKNVTITDTGISEAVDKVYDKTVIVTTYKDNQKYSSGSGFIYKVDKETTYIITNHHVVASGETYKITTTDEDQQDATLVGSDQYSDIAVLKVKTKSTYKEVEKGNSNKLKIGDTTFAIGAPLTSDYSWTVTKGIISGKERLVEISTTSTSESDYVMNVIQTDTAVNQGNSGGPLCNANGEVIGIISAKISGTGVEGMGFAIPIETATEKADNIINKKTTTYPYLGISMINLTDIKSYPNYYNYLEKTNLENGVVVMSVENNSPAKKAGLKEGDIITKLNDEETKNIAYLRYKLYKHKKGDKITITYERNGKTKTTKVKLTDQNTQA